MTAYTALTKAPIDVAALLTKVQHPGCGAVAMFTGTVRDHSDGRPVVRLEYEAYAAMAERQLQSIAQQTQQAHALHGIVIVHRVGTLEIGEIAVAVLTSSAHRAAALTACQEAIDLVKERVTIWKREHRPGGPAWIGAADTAGKTHDRARSHAR